MKKPYFYQYVDIIQIISSGISIIGSVFAIVALFSADANLFIIGILIIVAFGLVMLIIQVLKLKSVLQDRLESFTSTFHEFSRLMRDEKYSLKYAHKDAGPGKYRVASLQKATETACFQAVTLISDLFTSSLGGPFFASICIFRDVKIMNRTKKNKYGSRLSVFPVASTINNSLELPSGLDLRDHPGFEFILKDNGDSFINEDLSVYYSSLGGRQVQSFDFNKLGIESIMVVPIRLNQGLLTIDQNDENEWSINGFLSVYSKVRGAFRGSDSKHYLRLLKGFSDQLYSYLDLVYTFYDEIKPSQG